jgi:hypothetical protein
MSALLDGLSERTDIIYVTNDVQSEQAKISGLYVREEQASFVGVLVAHQDNEGLRSLRNRL